ncbi:M28 family metallopeptidase [Yinghuangia seranimata]|uniref:M28 family metallopeptidase n=1 Tax=Yinghuangia seranimata TaxID=408067 RepID=UPI00248C7B6D|nr:M28 family metallopeptidase [Yinghuangia seranimata]MDI2128262.1 M28 family metallopeptidase [Yinghuangia seranimata]
MTHRHLGRALTATLAGFALVGLAVTPAAAHPHDDAKLGDMVAKKVTADKILKHLKALQKIADNNNGTRVAGSPGHNASADYVDEALYDAGYLVTRQEFEFTYTETLAETLKVVSPAPSDVPIKVMSYSPSTPVGGITGQIAVVPADDADATYGCDPADYATGNYAGKIALIKRGGCTFAQKQATAAGAGAIAAVIYNRVPGDLNGTLGDPAAGIVPTGGITQEAGEALAAQAASGPVTITLELRQLREQRKTTNVIAESKWGDEDNVVMAGAHLDSVAAGPGINDNGSGSAALIEAAIQLGKIEDRPANKLRFAWWSGEEFGLLGSQAYVDSLAPADQRKIALYLNFDMIASPNSAEFVYDGDDSDHAGSPAGPAGSAEIEAFLNGYLDNKGKPHEGTDFDGRSDYGPFIAVGVPSGGTFTGAEGVKTADQAAKFGGTAGVAYDKCYHSACDTYANLDKNYLELNGKLMGYALGTFANNTHMVNGDNDGNPGLPPTLRAAKAPAAAAAGDHVAE